VLPPRSTLIPSILGFNRAFIQWAGITAGVAQSFYDFWEGFAVHYRGYLPSSGTGDTGWWVWAYTAQLGNGLSAVAGVGRGNADRDISAGVPQAVCSRASAVM
jgi:hypothetical protein